MKVNADHQKASDDRHERQLLDRIAGNDRDAFDELFRVYHPRLFRFVFRMTASYRTADEIVNDILLVVWQSAHTFRGDSKVSTWIFGIAYRRSLRQLRKRKFTTVPISDDTAVDENSHKRIEREDWVRRGIDELPLKQRLTVMLVYYLGLTYEETAAATGSPVNTVKTRMFHARRKLRDYLSKSAGETAQSAGTRPLGGKTRPLGGNPPAGGRS
jgi:RNA polymerase sigma-70 factor (ECF subfamily)